MIYLENTVSAQTVSIPRMVVLSGHSESQYNQGFQAGFTSGHTRGMEDQKALLVSTAITENGEYTKENGYSTVTVNVPTGSSIPLSSITITANTAITETDKAYTGITVNVPQTGYTQQDLDNAYDSGYTSGETVGYNSGYTSGYTEGFDSGYTSGNTDGYNSGHTEGMEDQKALLVSTALTQNGTYVRNDGFSSVTVNVSGSQVNLESKSYSLGDGFDPDLGITISPSSGYNGLSQVIISDDGYTQGKYNEGYMDGQASMADKYQEGYDDGYAVGENDGYNSGYSIGYDSGYTSGNTDGYNSGYTVGYNSGYSSGYTSGVTVGENNIISTFTAMTATTNGVYGSTEHPLSSITVNIPQSVYDINVLAKRNYNFVNPTITASTIEESAFGGCTGLTGSLELGSSVWNIKKGAFCGSSISEIIWPQYIDGGIFSVTAMTMRDGLQFAECPNLVSVEVPNYVSFSGTSISSSSGMFYSCINLVDVEFYAKRIPENCFRICNSLEYIYIENITSIGQGAFYGCTNLTEIRFAQQDPPIVSYGAFDYVPSAGTLYVPSGRSSVYGQFVQNYLSNWTIVEDE